MVMAERDELAVWIGGAYAGRLHRRDADIDFSYDTSYRTARTPALSASMPKSRSDHGGNVAGRWIDNLLPDNDDVRQRWARHFGEGRVDAFNLLRHMGADCAGAVQILPVDTSPDTDAGTESVDDAAIEQRLRELRRDPAEWNFADQGGRWSLGGGQGKFALAQRPDGSWETPTGRAASTHIFKVGVTAFADGDAVEYTTMRAAELLGIPVAQTTLRQFGDQTAMISRRFDRLVDQAGNVRRVHQEDMCQAHGLSRALKYESDGGPSVASISELMRDVVDPRDLAASRELFAKALLFNWLVVGTDAHAKNYALLHLGPRVRLAPLYDLAGAALVYHPNQVRYHGKLAMKMGGRYTIRDIAERHIVRTAVTVGVDPEWMRDTADRFIAQMPDVIAQAIEESHGLVPGKIATQMTAYMTQRVMNARRASPATSLGSMPGNSGDIWVAEHQRGGRVVQGHWRKRPGR